MLTDEFYMDMAEKVAAQYSDDPKTKVGCVIIGNCNGRQRVVATGVNKFPQGMVAKPDVNTDEKHRFILHAEQSALLNMEEEPGSRKAMTLYVTHAPCDVCCRLIAGAGIKTVVYRNVHKKSDLELLSQFDIESRQI